FATVYPFESCDGSKGYLSCRRRASEDEIKASEELYRKWKLEEK
ncbi:PAS sensor domain-containing protein, partial [Malaciobacter mytili LMG 24559]